jgi:hypothetical protein
MFAGVEADLIPSITGVAAKPARERRKDPKVIACLQAHCVASSEEAQYRAACCSPEPADSILNPDSSTAVLYIYMYPTFLRRDTCNKT